MMYNERVTEIQGYAAAPDSGGEFVMKKFLVILISLCLLTACGGSETVATVGNTKITKGEFEFYLTSIKEQLKGTELQTDEDWQTQEIEGEKAIEVAKQRAMEIAVGNASYCEVAKALGITLSETEKNSIKATKKRVIESYGGEEAYKTFLKNSSITDKFFDMLCESTIYYDKISDRVVSENPVTEELKQEYFEKNKASLLREYKKAKHILILTQDSATRQPLSEEEQQEAKEKADMLFEQIQAGADFDTLMTENSQDPGLETNPGGYVFSAGDMVPEFEQAVESVDFGEVTMCLSDFGYHIIMRLEPTYEDISDKIEESLVKELVTERIKDWEKEYKITVSENEEILKSIK